MGDFVSGVRLAFGSCRLDPAHRRLTRAAEAGDVPVVLGSRAMDLLILLVCHHGQLLNKAEIFEAVWPGTAVEDSNLTVQISSIRKALGREHSGNRWIETVPGRGYRFVAPVTELISPEAQQEAATADPLAVGLTAPAGTPHRLALAVLPFANLSADPEREYFVDGMAEELTTALSRVRWFSVVGRASTGAYKGQALDARQVGRELQVAYLLSGSVRQADERVRIACQLVNTETGHQVWAESFEGSINDIFALQDRVAQAVAGAVEPGLERAEMERVRTKPTMNMTSYDLYLRSLRPFFTNTEAGCAEAIMLLRRAAALDSEFGLAKAQLASCLTRRVEQGWANEGEREEGIRMAQEVLGISGADPLALTAVVYAFGILARDTLGALDVARRALDLNPNSAIVQAAAGMAYGWACDHGASAMHFAHALELNPFDPEVAYWNAGLARAELMAGRPETAVPLAELAIRQMAACVPAYRLLIAALSRLDRRCEASAVVGRLQSAVPSAACFSAEGFRRMYRDRLFADMLIQAWREAGLPE